MHRGTCKHPVTPGSVVEIRTDAEFTAYALENGERTSILGPNHSTERRLKFTIPPFIRTVEITTRKSGRYVFTETLRINHQEVPDKTPIEIGIHERPDPLAEQIQMIVQAEMSKLAVATGRESFEEANDFEIDDEDDPHSQYELTVLQEEHEPDPPPAEPAPSKKEPEPSCPPGEGSDSARPVQADTTPPPSNAPATPAVIQGAPVPARARTP